MGASYPRASGALQLARVVLIAVFMGVGILAWRNGSWFFVAMTGVGVVAAGYALVQGKAVRPEDREAAMSRLKFGAAVLAVALVVVLVLGVMEALGS